MAEDIKELSLQELQSCALKFFSNAFHSLPPLEAIKFGPLHCRSRHDQHEHICIHVASWHGHSVCMYVKNDCTLTYTQTSGLVTCTWGTLPYIAASHFHEPFKFVHSTACKPTCICDRGSDGELEVILLYYFALKGFNKTIKAQFLLGKFKNACESIAAQHKRTPWPYGIYSEVLNLDGWSEFQSEKLLSSSAKPANRSKDDPSPQLTDNEGQNLRHVHGNDADGATPSGHSPEAQPKSSIPKSKLTAKSSMLASPPSTSQSSTVIVPKLSPSFSDDFGAPGWTGACTRNNIEPCLKRPASTVKAAKAKDGSGMQATKRRKTAKPDAEQQRTQRDIHAAGTSSGKGNDIKTEISAEADFLSIEMGIESQNHASQPQTLTLSAANTTLQDNHSAVLVSATQYARDRKDDLTEKEAATHGWEARCKSLEARLAKSERRADKAILLKREYKKSRDMARRNAKAFEDRLANTEARFAEYKRSTEHKLAKASELYHRYKKIVELASTKDPVEEEFGDLVV